MDAIQIKAYLLKEGTILNDKALEKTAEIRRFGVENDANGLYKNLIDKIMHHFKNEIVHRREIKAYYMDNEGDFIGFSSDSELQFAITIQNILKKPDSLENNLLNTLKIYILRRKVSAESLLPASKLISSESTNPVAVKKDSVKEGRNNNKSKVCQNLLENFKSSLVSLKDSPEGLRKFREHIRRHMGTLGVEVDIDNLIDNVVESPEKPSEVIQDAIDYSTDPNSTASTVTVVDKDGNKTTVTKTSSFSHSTVNSVSPSEPTRKDNSVQKVQDVDEFNMVDIEKEVRIMKAVESLKSMGFDDENNWLTALVTSKDGHINAVLDALSNSFVSKNKDLF